MSPDPATLALDVRSPVTGELLGQVPRLDRAAVDALVLRARAAQSGWAARPLRERSRLLLAFRDRLIARAEDVARLSCRETGKLMAEALLTDVLASAGVCAWSARRARAVLGPRRVRTGWLLTKRAYEVREPYGVVGIISPWNWPVLNAMRAVFPAIVAGNTVILKPSEASPLTALLLRELADEAGWPADIFLIATGDGGTGAALVDAAIDKLSFTGSVATGRRIACAAAERLLPVSLELGGKDAVIVLEGADLQRAAAATVAGAFWNAGQICTSLERAYVQASVHDEFVRLLVEQTTQLRLGLDVGSLTVPAQLEKVEAQVRDAVARGARVLAGGRRALREGLYYEPTILADVTHEMEIMREETFGPVLPVMQVRDGDEAVRLANDSRFGLGSSIWGPPAVAASLVPRVRAGMTSVNDALLNALAAGLPFGGVGESGGGRVHGDEGLREMSWSRGVLLDRAGLRDTGFYPLDRISTATAVAAVQLLGGRGTLKLAALRRLLTGWRAARRGRNDADVAAVESPNPDRKEP